MNPTVCNPTLVSVFSAYLTAIIALLAVYIAYQQWRTARDKLKIDLFDRRVPIYELTRDILSRHLVRGQAMSSEETMEFAVQVRSAMWLYNRSISDYLQNEIYQNLQKLHDLDADLKNTDDQEQRKKIVEKQRQLREWVEHQRHNVIDKKFGKFLQMTK
jgi:hypothetical protein